MNQIIPPPPWAISPVGPKFYAHYLRVCLFFSFAQMTTTGHQQKKVQIAMEGGREQKNNDLTWLEAEWIGDHCLWEAHSILFFHPLPSLTSVEVDVKNSLSKNKSVYS